MISSLLTRFAGGIKRNHPMRFIYFKLFSPKLKACCKDISECYLFFRTEFPFLKYKTEEFDPAVNEKFNDWSGSGELEYLIRFNEPVLVEPYYSYALTMEGDIIPKSLPYGEVTCFPYPHYIYYKRKKIVSLPTAVSVSYNWFNYWHFYNDIIGQLYFLDLHNFDRSIPILVPERCKKIKYVDYFLQTGFAKRYNWVFQKSDEYYKINEIYFCKSIPNIAAQFIFAQKIFTEGLNLIPRDTGRIFLTRKKDRGRYLSNEIEILQLMARLNIQVLDADDMTLTQQIESFSHANLIIGIHGAGLTNMLYRYGRQCDVIEIFPREFIPAHYYWLAKELGFEYHPVLGTKFINDGFTVDAKSLEKLIQGLKDQPYANRH